MEDFAPRWARSVESGTHQLVNQLLKISPVCARIETIPYGVFPRALGPTMRGVASRTSKPYPCFQSYVRMRPVLEAS